MRRLLASLLLLSTLAVTRPAFAQGNDPVAATELFKQGRDALAKQDYATACRKFEDSLRLDEKVGTLLNLADCEEHQGKIAAARQHLQRGIDLASAQNDDRADLARQRFATLDKRVPRLTVTLSSSVEGVVVKRDGVPLGAGSLGTPLPVEPGKHVVTVSAPQREAKSYETSIAEGETKALEVAVGPAGSATETNDNPRAPSDVKETSGSGTRTIGWIVGGVGVAAIATGSVFALVAINGNSKSEDDCDGNQCGQTGFDARNDARTAGDIATGFFIGGGVLVGAGLALVLLSPSPQRSARVKPLVSTSGAGLAWGGTF